MTSLFKELEEKSRSLSAEGRERLAHKLSQSVDRQDLNEIDGAWLAVCEERFAALRSGKDEGLTKEEFFHRVRDRLGCT